MEDARSMPNTNFEADDSQHEKVSRSSVDELDR